MMRTQKKNFFFQIIKLSYFAKTRKKKTLGWLKIDQIKKKVNKKKLFIQFLILTRT